MRQNYIDRFGQPTKQVVYVGPKRIADFASHSESDWRDWLRHGIKLWINAIDVRERVLSFHPLPIQIDQFGPRHLSELLTDLPGSVTKSLDDGLAALIETENVAGDSRSAQFAFQLITLMPSCSRFESALAGFLSKPIHASNKELSLLSLAIAEASCRHLTASQIRETGQAMLDQGFLSPVAAIELVARLSVEEASNIEREATNFIPLIETESPHGRLSRLLIERLIARLTLRKVIEFAYYGETKFTRFLINVLQTQRVHARRLSETEFEIEDRMSDSKFIVEPDPNYQANIMADEFGAAPDVGIDTEAIVYSIEEERKKRTARGE